MGPGGVVVMQVLGQDLAQAAVLKDQQPAGQLASQGPGHRLADGVGSGCLRRADEDVDAFGGDHGVDGVSELAGAVPDQELDGIRAVAGVHQEVTGGLGRPGAVRMGGDAGQMARRVPCSMMIRA